MRALWLIPLGLLSLAACQLPYGGQPGVFGSRQVYDDGDTVGYGGYGNRVTGWPWGGSQSSGWYSQNGWSGDRGTFSPSRRVVCDSDTQVCYKRGQIDKSETDDAFGNRAADRADDIRDRYGRSDLYVKNRRTVCDDQQQVCYKNGHADRSDTREIYGKGAARNLPD